MKSSKEIEPNLRVLTDYQAFHIQRFGGITRYFFEIISRMTDVSAKISIAFSMNQYIRNFAKAEHTHINARVFKIAEGLFRKLNRQSSIAEIRKGNFDIFHPSYYDPYFVKYLDGKPFVLTIHDMTHEVLPEYFSPNDPIYANKRLLAEKATRIIAISECTKQDIIKIYGIDESKIDVIYHGIAPMKAVENNSLQLPDKYILYVGERRRYKNFSTLVEAFEQISKTRPDINLVLTGRKLSKEEKALFAQKDISNKVFVFSSIDDNTLALLYRKAEMFVYPSLYEGFGIPILEAFSNQCPVVLSKASCFPEVAGDAAEYFEATNVGALIQSITKILDNKSYRDELVAKGNERLKLFTWDNTAKETVKTYKKAIEEFGNKPLLTT